MLLWRTANLSTLGSYNEACVIPVRNITPITLTTRIIGCFIIHSNKTLPFRRSLNCQLLHCHMPLLTEIDPTLFKSLGLQGKQNQDQSLRVEYVNKTKNQITSKTHRQHAVRKHMWGISESFYWYMKAFSWAFATVTLKLPVLICLFFVTSCCALSKLQDSGGMFILITYKASYTLVTLKWINNTRPFILRRHN